LNDGESTSPEVWGRHLTRRTLRLPILRMELGFTRSPQRRSGRWIPLPGLICCATSWRSRQRRSLGRSNRSQVFQAAFGLGISSVLRPRRRTKGQAEAGLLIKDPRGCPRPSPSDANEARCRAVVAGGMRLANKTPPEGKPRRSESPACLLWDGLLLLMAPLSSRASGCMQHPHETPGKPNPVVQWPDFTPRALEVAMRADKWRRPIDDDNPPGLAPSVRSDHPLAA
jgi:hypothetical protein